MAYTTNAGWLRLLLADVGASQVLADDQVGGYLGAYGLNPETDVTVRGDVRRAAADALDAIATSESLIGKVVRTADGLSTDGTKVAADLRAHAARMRDLAVRDDDQQGIDDGGFLGIAEFEPYPW
ncbi:hypothetical protein [Xylanimonas protaetiae]|uniref:Uncharacterized protein n=1 Tax=Xylanimonas protaetiae TaxID=2509457 RepID=A0A4P6F334_9MICO|nr:hypothetical protein [Xylanimonas protaetiae]QAY69992.1 hypothetical protein ET471_08075 [Xylanimonas protaetiae]